MCTKPALPRLLFLAALIVRSIGDGSPELAETLRRQLMRDNYDYSSEASEESSQLATLAAHEPSPVPVTPSPTLQPFINEVYVPRGVLDASLPPDLNDTSTPLNKGDQALRKKELLYYVDEGHLSRRAGNPPLQKEDDGELSQPDGDMLSREEGLQETTPKVKYKVLKVKEADGAKGWRRSGSRSRYRRFLQEEKPDGGGVALINLGDGPFPEFRLPQYSRHSNSAPDLEVAVPSDIDEPITRPF